jgi:signal transduction histidine kinase
MDYLKLKKFLFSLTLILISLTSLANAYRIDSIRVAIDNILKTKGNKALKTNINTDYYSAETTKINQYLSVANKFQTSNDDSLLFYSQKAMGLSLKLADLEYISSSVQMLGNYFKRKEDYSNSGECYLLSLKIEEKNKNRKRIADLNKELGAIYYYQEVFGKSLSYYSDALVEYEKERDTLNIAKVYSHLGTLYNSREYCEKRSTEQKREDFNTAIQYFEKSIQLSTQLGHKAMVINGYLNIASVYNKFEQPEKSLPYLNNAEDYFRKTKDIGSLTSTLHTLGITYYKLKQYNQSIKSFEESLKISIDNKSLDGLQYLYESMAQTYDANKDYKNALNYYRKYMTVKDSVNGLQKSKELFELETKYQTEKKENEIIKLTSQKQERNLLLYALSGLILILCILGYFIMKNIRNKKLIAEQTLEIKDQHIQELEKERQLIATKSVLKGEESERSRMARDLHDGLGGLLSGVKINLSSIKGNSIISSENAVIFDQAIKLLDNSIIELRRVAHSLMPETLIHYGLKTAFNDFIADLSTNVSHVLSFRFSGEDIRYNSQLELTVYRIAQELVNNALKHSGAKNIDLQLIAEMNRVCIQVIDNGKGFDSSDKSGTGKGLVSIRERVASTNGRFDMESSPGHGTEATVEFLL